jgi:outer membrane protein assembly factor BamB
MAFRSFLRICAAVLGAAGTLHAQSIVQTIPLPSSTFYNSVWGLAADSSGLHLAANSSTVGQGNKILRLTYGGAVRDSLILPPFVLSNQGLARDAAGNSFFMRRYTSAGTIMKISPSGAVLDSMRIPKFLGGVAWDGSHVWYSVYSPNAEAGLYKVDFTAKTVVDTILVPTRQPYGVTWDGTSLYYVENGFDGDRRGILRVNPVTGDTTGFIPEPPDGSSNGTNPSGVAWDGRYLWLVGEPVGASTGRVLYKYDLTITGTPDIDVLPLVQDFGGVRIAQPRTVNLTLRNTGDAPLRITAVNGTTATFTTAYTAPDTIPPGGSRSLPVTFTPSAFGPDSALLTLLSNDPDEGAKAVRLRGSGIYASPTLSTVQSHDFGTRRSGSSNSWKIPIRNLGGPPLSIASMRVGLRVFALDSLPFPVVIDSLGTQSFRIWFRPTSAGLVRDTLVIESNAAGGTVRVPLTGTGDAAPVPVGLPLWQHTVADHPVSNTGRLVKAVRDIGDLNGDSKRDVIVSTENYWTMALNGASSVDNDSLWAFTSYVSNSSAGSIGTAGDYSHQKALAVASDLDADGVNDVVIGTGGGNERVYALSGRSGRIIWSYGTDHPDSFSLGDFTGVDAARDFNGDGVPDVVAAAAATQSGGVGGRRSIYLFHGRTGAILWQSPLLGFTHGVASVGDINSDGRPDAVGTVGEPGYRAVAFNGATGGELWNFPIPSASGGAKEVLEFPVTGQSPDIVVGAFWGPVYRIDGATGRELWSYPTGGRGVMQMRRLRDVTGDGVDEVLAALLLGGARCLNGATGAEVWSLPTGSTMGVATVPDLNRDGFDEVAWAVQDQGAMIVRGNNGVQLALFPFGTNECREVAAVPDADGNASFEILAGSKFGQVALISGGTDAGTSAAEEGESLPREFSLDQNYPNPFNPVTSIRVSMAEKGDLTITIHDLLGRVVRTFAFTSVPPGAHTVVWDGTGDAGRQVSSGVYFYRAQTGERVLTRRMVLLR